MMQITLRTILTITMVCQTAAVLAETCDYGSRHPAMPEAFDQYAFMIGDFRIEVRRGEGDGWTDEASSEAYWRGRYIMDGVAIMDEWFNADPMTDPDTGRGVNIRFWDMTESKWKIAWQFVSDPEVRTLESSLDEQGRLRLYRIHDEDFAATADGQEIYFESYSNDHWARITTALDENGDYKPQLKLEAFRVDCPQ